MECIIISEGGGGNTKCAQNFGGETSWMPLGRLRNRCEGSVAMDHKIRLWLHQLDLTHSESCQMVGFGIIIEMLTFRVIFSFRKFWSLSPSSIICFTCNETRMVS
jgi:hypothetical protein